jgi:uncharacterized protein RhaS with RHS repeats
MRPTGLSKLSAILLQSQVIPISSFSYDAQGRVIEATDYGNAFGPDAFQETRKFYYDAAGNCVGDSGFNQNGIHTWYRDNLYTYDAQGRLLTKTHASGNVERFEYGTTKNPVKWFIRYVGLPELLVGIYASFDDKPSWIGECKTLNLYYRNYGGKYHEEFFANNPTKWKEGYYIIGNAIGEYADIDEEYQYDSNNMPVKRKVIQRTSSGSLVHVEEEYEYIYK